MGIFEIEKYEINDFVPDLSQSEIVWILSIWIGWNLNKLGSTIS